jgi:GNAT superfamily N-acetyltransferase
MTWELSTPSTTDIPELDDALKCWDGTFGTAAGFASGDLGWALRHGLEEAASLFRVVRSADGTIGAIGYVEGPNALWLTIDPSRLLDRELAEAIADQAVAQEFHEVATAAAPAAIRRSLAARGYAIDPEAWVHLWKPLTDADIADVPGVVATSTPDLIDQRIAVQRSAFAGSTFSLAKWQAMAEGPSFVPALDLVALDDRGTGVSIVTAWLPGPNACGMIEPMGTHADHQRKGHGLRVLRASFSELRKLGASGVRVYTPRGNNPAVATYQAAGFAIIGLDTTMVRSDP